MNFSIFLHFPFLSLYIEFDNKYIIFSSVFLFYKNDRAFTLCRFVCLHEDNFPIHNFSRTRPYVI